MRPRQETSEYIQIVTNVDTKMPMMFSHTWDNQLGGGEGGIRTLEARFSELAPLAGVCLQPLGHFSAPLSLHSNKNTHCIRLFIIFQVCLRESYWFSHPIWLQ